MVNNKRNSPFGPTKEANVKLGPLGLAATGTAAVAAVAVALLFIPFVLAFVTMILFGILHAEVALGIPAFGYWASFWITLAWAYAASFFRSGNSN